MFHYIFFRISIYGLFLTSWLSGICGDGNHPTFWWKSIKSVESHRHETLSEYLEIVEIFPEIKQRSFIPYGRNYFVRYSAYRHGKRSIFVLGSMLSEKYKLKRNVFEECFWLSRGRSLNTSFVIKGKARNVRVGENHDYPYEQIIVHCMFPTDTLTPKGSHGYLFLQVSKPKEDQNSTTGAHNETGRGEPKSLKWLVYEETSVSNTPNSSSKPEFDIAHCGSPLFRRLNPKPIFEWYNFHSKLLADFKVFFFVYDGGGCTWKIRSGFAKFLPNGTFSIDDFSKQSKFRSWAQGQLLTLNDCVHRSRGFAKWVFNFDYDEFLLVPPPATVKSYFSAEEGVVSVSFASIQYSTVHCIVESNQSHSVWSIRSMRFRDRVPPCSYKIVGEKVWVCEGAIGLRKWIVNPSLSSLVHVHAVVDRGNARVGLRHVVVHAKEAYLGHLRGIISKPNRVICQQRIVLGTMKLRIKKRRLEYNEDFAKQIDRLNASEARSLI